MRDGGKGWYSNCVTDNSDRTLKASNMFYEPTARLSRPFQQLSNERFGGRIPRQRVQVALDEDDGRFFLQDQGLCKSGDSQALNCVVHLPRPG